MTTRFLGGLLVVVGFGLAMRGIAATVCITTATVVTASSLLTTTAMPIRGLHLGLHNGLAGLRSPRAFFPLRLAIRN